VGGAWGPAYLVDEPDQSYQARHGPQLEKNGGSLRPRPSGPAESFTPHFSRRPAPPSEFFGQAHRHASSGAPCSAHRDRALGTTLLAEPSLALGSVNVLPVRRSSIRAELLGARCAPPVASSTPTRHLRRIQSPHTQCYRPSLQISRGQVIWYNHFILTSILLPNMNLTRIATTGALFTISIGRNLLSSTDCTRNMIKDPISTMLIITIAI